MKHLKITLLFFILLNFTVNAQIEVASKVKEATLFSNKAQVTRIQNVSLKKGENEIKFYGLESSINKSSFQISGTNGITIISNNMRRESSTRSSQSPQVRKLNDSIKMIQRQESLTRNSIKNLNSEKQMILSNKDASGKDGFNIDNMADLSEYYRANLDKIDVMIYDKNQQITELREQRRRINDQLKNLGFRNRSNTLFVTVYSEKAQTVSIKLIYLVNNIGWTPYYEIKSKGIGTKISTVCKAKIYQNSQVDWNNVSLKLSTNNPMNYGTIPTIHPWVLRFQNERKRYAGKKRERSSSTGYQYNSSYPQAEEVASGSSYDSKSLSSFTNSTDNMIQREFNISLPYSIKGSNGKAVIELESYELEAEYVYYAAPKFNCDVFLIAHINDWEQYNLLPGTANLFLEGTFVGTTMINPNSIADTMSLTLGKDESIVIKREKIRDMSRNTILGGNKKIDMGIQLTVKNNKGKEINIIVEDQVPTTSDEKIEINIKDVSGAKKEDSTGKLTWKYKLKAGDTKIHKIKYEVKHPKNKSLSNF